MLSSSPLRTLIRRAARSGRHAELEELLHRYGLLRMLNVRNFRIVDRDPRHRVTLWTRAAGPDPWLDAACEREAVLEMENPTAEDGAREHFAERVPGTMVSARQALAWTHGLEAHQYRPRRQA